MSFHSHHTGDVVMGRRTIGRTFAMAAFVAVAMLLAGSLAQAQVGISVEVSQPGVYGRVDIGGLTAPRLILPKPVVIAPLRGHAPEPGYLWEPPEHPDHWARHCYRYSACGVPVYFVRDDWYRDHVHHDDKGGRHDDRRRGDSGERGGDGHGRGGDHEQENRGRHENR
jgi:hypothetical protein